MITVISLQRDLVFSMVYPTEFLSFYGIDFQEEGDGATIVRSLPPGLIPINLSLKPSRELRKNEANHEVKQGHGQEYLKGCLHGPAVYLRSRLGELAHPYDVGQGSVLGEGDELVHEGRNHIEERLR